MYKNKVITVVIPCHNEEDGLLATKKMIPDFVDHILVVDNFSTDKTYQVALDLGLLVVQEHEKKGYGYAYQKGFANLPVDTDIVVTCDGDGTYPMDELISILDLIVDKNYDFISCARFPLRDKQAMKFLNKFGNMVLTLVFLILTMRLIKDSQSGMWVFKKEVLKKIKLTSGGMPLSEEIKMEAMLNPKINFYEFHIGYNDRIGHTTLNRFKDGWDNLVFLFKKRWDICNRKYD
jgi:glycosyltransferase involved in cell wall biosynthesis